MLANKIGISWVIWINRHSSIAQQGFWPSGGDYNIVLAVQCFDPVSQGVAQIPHFTFDITIFDFQIGDGGMQFRIPVDQSFAAVDQTILMQADKSLLYRCIEALVHGEAFGFPVHRVTQTAHLTHNGIARLLFPLPGLFDKFFTAQCFTTGLPLSGKFAFDNHLRGDTRMITAHLPQRIFALHTVIACQSIHNAMLKGMADMQATSYIRGRDHYAVGVFLRCHIRREIASLFPGFIPFGFYILGGKCFFHY